MANAEFALRRAQQSLDQAEKILNANEKEPQEATEEEQPENGE